MYFVLSCFIWIIFHLNKFIQLYHIIINLFYLMKGWHSNLWKTDIWINLFYFMIGLSTCVKSYVFQRYDWLKCAVPGCCPRGICFHRPGSSPKGRWFYSTYWAYSHLKVGEGGSSPILHINQVKLIALACKICLAGSVTNFWPEVWLNFAASLFGATKFHCTFSHYVHISR